MHRNTNVQIHCPVVDHLLATAPNGLHSLSVVFPARRRSIEAILIPVHNKHSGH